MSKPAINIYARILIPLVLLPARNVMALQDYTYVQSSLAFPWFMFFVFFALILIPFFMVIVLAWRKPGMREDEVSDMGASLPSSPDKIGRKGVFNRIVLPVILVGVGVFSILLVLNAYQAMDLMETLGTAAPTMLNARP